MIDGIRNFFKDIMKDVFKEDIERYSRQAVDEKITEILSNEIKIALEPTMTEIAELNKTIHSRIGDIDDNVNQTINEVNKSIDASINSIKTGMGERIERVADTLDKKFANLDINIDGLDEYVSEKAISAVRQNLQNSVTFRNVVVDKFNTHIKSLEFFK